jgi:predicted GNAT family N-acyltransferase
MAVLSAWRQRGVGSALLRELVSIARDQGIGEVVLNAQTYAMGFYERHGFVAEGPEFLDAGIAHRKMRLGLG